MVINQTEHKMSVDKGGIQANTILKMSDCHLQLARTRMADTMLKVLADELLTLRRRVK